MLGISSPSD